MKELTIKTRTSEFIFPIEEDSLVVIEREVINHDITGYLISEGKEKIFCKSGDILVHLITDSPLFKNYVLSPDFALIWGDSDNGICFYMDFSIGENFQEYLKKTKIDRYFNIMLNFSEIIELTLNGKSLI